jgi:hypothetical protein
MKNLRNLLTSFSCDEGKDLFKNGIPLRQKQKGKTSYFLNTKEVS